MSGETRAASGCRDCAVFSDKACNSQQAGTETDLLVEGGSPAHRLELLHGHSGIKTETSFVCGDHGFDSQKYATPEQQVRQTREESIPQKRPAGQVGRTGRTPLRAASLESLRDGGTVQDAVLDDVDCWLQDLHETECPAVHQFSHTERAQHITLPAEPIYTHPWILQDAIAPRNRRLSYRGPPVHGQSAASASR